MRNACKLTLLAVLATAATALTAPSALAQVEPLTHTPTSRTIVAQEVHAANDLACPAIGPSPPPVLSPIIVTGGCRLHMGAPNVTQTSHLAAGGAEVVVAICTWELNVRIDSSGEGWMSHQEMFGAPDVCTRKICGQPTPPGDEGRSWSFFMQETEPAPTERVTFLMCTQTLAGADTSHCELTLPVSQPALHRYRFTAVDASGHGAVFPHCEVSGTVDVEAVLGVTGENQAEQNVEIRHP